MEPLRVIPTDLHALRQGEPAAGYVIVCATPEGRAYSDVNNKIFPTLESATAHALTIHESWQPKVKAVRWTEQPTDPAERMARAMQLRDELFNLANSFAGDETGHVAGLLHIACNYIFQAKQALTEKLEGGFTSWDDDRR